MNLKIRLTDFTAKCPLFIKLFVGLAITTYSTNVYSQSWEWIKTYGALKDDFVIEMVSDFSGNAYVIGQFKNTSIIFGVDTLFNFGPNTTYDIFITKFDALGEVVWAKGIGGPDSDEGNSIALDSNGNLYVTGSFAASLTIDSLNVIGLGVDIFVAKYDTSGNLIWVRSAGGTNIEYSNDVVADISGNITITGTFRSTTMNVGLYSLQNSNNGTDDIFVIRYDNAGNVVWAKKASGSGGENAEDIICDPAGNCYLFGTFNSPTLSFGTISLVNTSPGTNDIFLLKIDISGNGLWGRKASGSVNEYIGGLSDFRNGCFYVVGYFESLNLNFGTVALTNSCNCSYKPEIYLAKYNASGTLVFAESYGSNEWDIAYDISLDNNGNCLISGSFSGINTVLGNDTLVSVGGTDVLTFKTDSVGNVIWALSAGSLLNDGANCVSHDSNGNWYAAGWYEGPGISFGAINLPNTIPYSNNMFLAKISSNISSINDAFEYPSFLVHPNPSSFILSIPPQFLHFDLDVMDVTGRVVFREKNVETTEFGLEHLNPGTYFIRCIKDNHNFQTKWVKM